MMSIFPIDRQSRLRVNPNLIRTYACRSFVAQTFSLGLPCEPVLAAAFTRFEKVQVILKSTINYGKAHK